MALRVPSHTAHSTFAHSLCLNRSSTRKLSTINGLTYLSDSYQQGFQHYPGITFAPWTDSQQLH